MLGGRLPDVRSGCRSYPPCRGRRRAWDVHRLTGFEQFHPQGRLPPGRNRRCRNKPGKANRINMKTRIDLVLMLALALTLIGATLTIAQQTGSGPNVPPPRPKGPCDIYAAAGDPCVAA